MNYTVFKAILPEVGLYIVARNFWFFTSFFFLKESGDTPHRLLLFILDNGYCNSVSLSSTPLQNACYPTYIFLLSSILSKFYLKTTTQNKIFLIIFEGGIRKDVNYFDAPAGRYESDLIYTYEFAFWNKTCW